MSESDFIAENGDRWVVRGCDAEDGCIVVERFMLRNPPQGLDKLVDDFAREATGQPPRATEEVPDDEADDNIHIPAGVVQAIAAALASSKPGGIRLALEQLAEDPLVANGCPRCFDSRYIARKALADLESSKPSPAFVDLFIEEAASYRAKQKARSRQSDDSYRNAVARHQAAMAAVDNDPAAALALAEKEAGK